MHILRTALPLALAFLTACGGSEDGPAVTDRERAIGAQQHPQLLAEFGGAYDGPEAAYVAAVGEKLAGAADLSGQCTFTLVNSDVVNAFAVPGCYIYVTRGLLGIVNSEDELASVLAHEVGHITGNHGERQSSRSVLRGLGVVAVSILTQSERLSRLAGQAANFFTLRYSRTQEYDADDRGLAYLSAAGYAPRAAADMLGALTRNEAYMTRTRGDDAARGIPEWARTHPLTENRVARAREAAATRPDRAENEAGYLAEVDGLLYGDDPQQGFVNGRRFAHPVMRIGFEAPQGFTLTNSPQAIVLEGPDGARGEFAGGALGPGGLEAYASALLGQILGQAQAQVGPARSFRANGIPALAVPVTVATEGGPVSLTLAAYEGGDGGAYHFLMVSAPGTGPSPALSELFASFRMLSAAEASNLQPRRIQVVTALPGDTPQTLGARMAADDRLETFLMINGRGADQAIQAGQEVKLVAFAPR